MKLQLRFILVLAAIFLGATSFLLLQQRFEIDRSNRLLASELSQHKTYFQNIVDLDGRSVQALDEDYSFWDAMVSFIQTDDVSFAQENLDTGLSTFNTDADWVYRPNGTLLYFSSADGTNTLKPINLPQAFFKKLTTSKFAHFYIKIAGNVVEIRAATVVPSDDQYHATPEQGFLVVGRVLGASYTKNIATLSASNVQLSNPSNTKDEATNSNISFGEVLSSWNNQPVAVLRSTSTIQVVSDLKNQYKTQLELLAIFTVVFTAIVIALLFFLVLQPVSIVIKAIKLQDPKLLDTLKDQHTEFGSLAQTVAEFFAQKVSLAEAEFRKIELEKLNKEKASFLAVAAHEMNGPVSNVKLFSEFLTYLLKKHAPQSDIDEEVRMIEHQTIKISMLLNDLRTASSGSQGLQFNLRDFDFDSFLHEEVKEAAFSIKTKLNLTTEAHATIHSDPDRLGQVVSNLIRNAVKYSPNGGEVVLNGKSEDGHIILSVKDSGVGIGPDDIPHLFERFYRSIKVSGSFPGLGLGLYISKNIIESLGGKMWVESELGKGSTFYFSLPIVSVVTATPPPTAPTTVPPRPDASSPEAPPKMSATPDDSVTEPVAPPKMASIPVTLPTTTEPTPPIEDQVPPPKL